MACAIIKSGISPCLLGRIGVSTVQPVRTAMRQIRVLQRREPPRDKKVKQVIMHKDVIRAFQRDQMLEKDALDRDRLEEILREQEGGQTRAGLEDMPIFGMDNPYEKPPKKCLLCEHNLSLDYKNVRLLSQFVSPHTGQIYGRHITGLCLYVQRRISKLIARARYLGFMPYTMKEPRYMRDPKLYDPFGRR